MKKLSVDDLKYIHDNMLERYRGLPGERNHGMLEYVCEKPFLVTFGQEQYPDLFQKAAVLMYALARGHYFNDGNKRTASMAAYVFLLQNGYELIVSDDEFYKTVIRVASGNYGEDTLADWLKENSQPTK